MNPSGKCPQERLTRGTLTSTIRKAAFPPGCARCGAGAGCSAIKYQSLYHARSVAVKSTRSRADRKGQNNVRSTRYRRKSSDQNMSLGGAGEVADEPHLQPSRLEACGARPCPTACVRFHALTSSGYGVRGSGFVFRGAGCGVRGRVWGVTGGSPCRP